MVPCTLSEIIVRRMAELGIDQEALGRRLGYQSPAKAAGRVVALIKGVVDSPRSQRALARLPDALEVTPEEVAKAIAATRRWQTH